MPDACAATMNGIARETRIYSQELANRLPTVNVIAR